MADNVNTYYEKYQYLERLCEHVQITDNKSGSLDKYIYHDFLRGCTYSRPCIYKKEYDDCKYCNKKPYGPEELWRLK